MRLIIDGHLDLAMSAIHYGRDITLELQQINAAEAGLIDDRCRGHAMVSLPQMRRGGVAVCFSTLLARSSPIRPPQPPLTRLDLDYFNQDVAYAMARAQLAYYQRLHQRGEIRLIGARRDLDEHWKQWSAAAESGVMDNLPVGVILTMECADPIVEPEQVEFWHRLGLRMIMPAHVKLSHYAGGNGSGGGLSPRGRALIRAMRRHGMVLDLSHLADESIVEAMEIHDGPVIASHSNCRALAPSPRQLSDQTIRAIIERGGVIGVVIFNCFLRSGYDYQKSDRMTVTPDVIVDHIDHIRDIAGATDHIALGSDFDGGYGNEATPAGMDSIADLQKLAEVLSARGYDDAQIDAIFHGNWLRFLRKNLT